MYIRTYIHIYVCTCIPIHTNLSTHIYMCVRTYPYTRTCHAEDILCGPAASCVCMYISMYARTCGPMIFCVTRLASCPAHGQPSTSSNSSPIVCVCVFKHTHIHTYTHTYKHTCMASRRPRVTRLLLCTCVCVYVCVFKNTHIHTYTHTYTHIYIHTNIHACMHACMHACIHTCICIYT